MRIFFLSSSGEKVETSPNPMATAPTDDSRESSPAEDEVILATAGYDHCIKFWTAHTGKGLFTNYFYKRRMVGSQKFRLFVNHYKVENVNGRG